MFGLGFCGLVVGCLRDVGCSVFCVFVGLVCVGLFVLYLIVWVGLHIWCLLVVLVCVSCVCYGSCCRLDLLVRSAVWIGASYC